MAEVWILQRKVFMIINHRFKSTRVLKTRSRYPPVSRLPGRTMQEGNAEVKPQRFYEAPVISVKLVLTITFDKTVTKQMTKTMVYYFA